MFLNCLINCYRPGICIYDSGVALKNWWALNCTKYRFFPLCYSLSSKCQHWNFYMVAASSGHFSSKPLLSVRVS